MKDLHGITSSFWLDAFFSHCFFSRAKIAGGAGVSHLLQKKSLQTCRTSYNDFFAIDTSQNQIAETSFRNTQHLLRDRNNQVSFHQSIFLPSISSCGVKRSAHPGIPLPPTCRRIGLVKNMTRWSVNPCPRIWLTLPKMRQPSRHCFLE